MEVLCEDEMPSSLVVGEVPLYHPKPMLPSVGTGWADAAAASCASVCSFDIACNGLLRSAGATCFVTLCHVWGRVVYVDAYVVDSQRVTEKCRFWFMFEKCRKISFLFVRYPRLATVRV